MQEKIRRNAEIVRRIQEGEVFDSIAGDFGISRTRVTQIGEDAGLEPRGLRMGKDHPAWKGGQFQAGSRIRTLQPEHPRADRQGYVDTLILEAEEKLGRALVPGVEFVLRTPEGKPQVLTRKEFYLTMSRRNQKFSDEELLDVIRWVAIRLGRTPTALDIQEYALVSSAAYRRRFGSFSRVSELAGLFSNIRGQEPEELDEEFEKVFGFLADYPTPEGLIRTIRKEAA